MHRSFLLGVMFSLASPALWGAAVDPVNDPRSPINWKIYSNETYGFQFKYPPMYQVRLGYKPTAKTVFSTHLKKALFSVSLFEKGEYTGFSILVTHKGDIFFRSKALPGFYKYEPAINAWLGYNPVSTEYGQPQKTYFYLAGPMCANVDLLGPLKIPVYGTTRLVPKSQPRNDILLTNRSYAIEIPREELQLERTPGTLTADLQDEIRDTLALVEPVQAITADCSAASLEAEKLKLPAVIEPKEKQEITITQPLKAALDQKLPPGIGAVFYLSTMETADSEKIVYESPVGDLAAGDTLQLRCQDVLVPPTDGAATAMSLHVLFYKNVGGRKVLIGEPFIQTIHLSVK
jgi:hypothetical protein